MLLRQTTNFVLQAQEAFHYQTVLKRIEPGTRFDDWRRDQVMDAVGKPGISKIARPDWKTVKAHLLTLAEPLDPRTLHGLLSHLRNHIALREGRDIPKRRAKRVYPKKPDPGEMDDPF